MGISFPSSRFHYVNSHHPDTQVVVSLPLFKLSYFFGIIPPFPWSFPNFIFPIINHFHRLSYYFLLSFVQRWISFLSRVDPASRKEHRSYEEDNTNEIKLICYWLIKQRCFSMPIKNYSPDPYLLSSCIPHEDHTSSNEAEKLFML